MKLGTQIRFTDGREATVVYNSLIGVGIKWGLHDSNPEDFEDTDGNVISSGVPDGFVWEPDAILRKPWAGSKEHGFTEEQCVPDQFDIINQE